MLNGEASQCSYLLHHNAYQVNQSSSWRRVSPSAGQATQATELGRPQRDPIAFTAGQGTGTHEVTRLQIQGSGIRMRKQAYIYICIYIYVNNSSSQLLKIISFLFGYCNHLNAEILNANL